MSTRDIIFRGDGTMTVDAFLGSLRLKATEAGKLRDSDWMADYLSACVEGPALEWYETLDEETQQDWKKVRRELIAKYTTTTSGHPPAAGAIASSPQVPTAPTALSVPHSGGHNPSPGASADTGLTQEKSPLGGLFDWFSSILVAGLPTPSAAQKLQYPSFHHIKTYPVSDATGPITSFAFTPPGVSPPRIALYYPKLGIRVYRIDGEDNSAIIIRLQRATNTLGFSPDGNFIAYDVVSASGVPSQHLVIQEFAGMRFTQYAIPAPFHDFVFSPFDMSIAILQTGRTVDRLDIVTKAVRPHIHQHARQIEFIPDAKNWVTILGDSNISVYDWVYGNTLFILPVPNTPLCISSPSHSTIASGGKFKTSAHWGHQFSTYIWDCSQVARGARQPNPGYMYIPAQGIKIKRKLHTIDFLSTIETIACSPDGSLLGARGQGIADCMLLVRDDTKVDLPSTLTDSPWKLMHFLENGSMYATLHHDGTFRLHGVSWADVAV